MHHFLSSSAVRRTMFALALIVAPLLALTLATPALAAGTAGATAPLIVVDPGHGGRYSNANANGLREKTVNLQVALVLRDRLVARGYRVVMTRETDRAVQLGDIPTWNYRSSDGSWSYRSDGITGMDGTIPEDDLQARADRANRAGADLFISVHSNGAQSTWARGFETFASTRDVLGRSLSSVVQRAVIARTGLRDRGAQTRDFYVCRWTNMPAILVETAFITNPSDAALLKSAAFRARIAEGIAAGVDQWMATKPFRPVLQRVGGNSADSHAAALAAATHPSGAPVAVLARSDRWYEVPGAVSLAASLGGPLLWVDAGSVPTATVLALSRLAPSRIIVVGTTGGLASLTPTLVAEAAAVETSAVAVITAPNSAALSASVAASMGVGPSGVVVISSASAARVSLAAASVAAALSAPQLLAIGGELSPEASAFLQENRPRIRRVILVGSRTTVPDALAGDVPVIRYSASDLPTAAWLFNNARFKNRALNSLRPIVADGRCGPEYLASALYASRIGQPLLPAEGRVLPPKTREWITNHRSATAAFEVHDARRATPLLMDHLLRKADYL